jgi:hypothetical protein
MDDNKFTERLIRVMEKEGRKWEWLSEATGIPYHQIYHRRVGRNGKKGIFTNEQERQIKDALGHEHFENL